MIKVLPLILTSILPFFVCGCDDHHKQAAKQGGQMTSQLDWFEIEITPHEFRIGVGPGKTGIIAYKPDGIEQVQTTVLLPESNRENYALIMRSLENLLTKFEIENSAQHEPGKFFLSGPAREEPAMYLRFVHGDKVWQSRYNNNEIPPNMQALYAGCRELAAKVCDQSPKRRLSPDEALKIKDERMGK